MSSLFDQLQRLGSLASVADKQAFTFTIKNPFTNRPLGQDVQSAGDYLSKIPDRIRGGARGVQQGIGLAATRVHELHSRVPNPMNPYSLGLGPGKSPKAPRYRIARPQYWQYRQLQERIKQLEAQQQPAVDHSKLRPYTDVYDLYQ